MNPAIARPVARPRDGLFADRYRAISARDARFDGQFITAVRSTRIYCRPSCPARTPRPENVAFFVTAAAAQARGYRACRRCLPDAVPDTPQWNARGDLVGRALRLIADGVVDREGVAGLATRLGYSGRHLQQLLAAEVGAGPLALARAQRAQTARTLLLSTDLRLSDVAFAAGFGSIRQFNDTITQIYAMTPGQLRAGRRVGTQVTASGTGEAVVRLSLALPVRHPFDAPSLISFLAARALPGVEAAETHGTQLRYARTLGLPHGPGAAQVRCAPTQEGSWSVTLELELTTLADLSAAVTRMRRLLDLDADCVAISTVLGTDPQLAPLVSIHPGMRLPGAVDPHELAVRAIVGQQISVGAARTQLSRLATAGPGYASQFAGLDRLFPCMAQVAEVAPAHLRLPRRNLQTVVDTASALATGEIVVDVGQDSTQLQAALVARAGIGPWTAGYVAMRVLGDPDVWLSGNVALLSSGNALQLVDAGGRAQQMRQLAARAATWSPWRSYAQLQLWHATTAIPKSNKGTA